MTSAPIIISESANAGYDPRAVSVARKARERIDAECIILFGSRSRADWKATSDIDLMAIVRRAPARDERDRATETVRRILSETYSERGSMPMDLLFLSETDYRRRAKSVNNVAAIASREGIKLAREPEDYAEPETEIDDEVEREDRVRRITHANSYYRLLNHTLDGGIADSATVFLAHQVLEHGMKALISARGRRYPHTHDLDELASEIRRIDIARRWRFASDLLQLSGYAGADRYREAVNPVTDFTRMANAVTDDIERIYRRIQEITGEDPWSVPPDDKSEPISPRRRRD